MKIAISIFLICCTLSSYCQSTNSVQKPNRLVSDEEIAFLEEFTEKAVRGDSVKIVDYRKAEDIQLRIQMEIVTLKRSKVLMEQKNREIEEYLAKQKLQLKKVEKKNLQKIEKLDRKRHRIEKKLEKQKRNLRRKGVIQDQRKILAYLFKEALLS